MKASKILAGMSALAMAGAMLSIVSFADAPADITLTSGSWFELDNNDGTDQDGKQLKLIQSWSNGVTSDFWADSTELYVTFEVTGYTGDAYLAYQVANRGTSAWDAGDANPAVTIDGDGEYTVSATGISPIGNGFNFLAVIFDSDATAKVTNISTTAPVEDSSSEETSSEDSSSEADPNPAPGYEYEYEVASDYFNGNTVYLMGEAEKNENGPFNDFGSELAKAKAIKFTVTVDDPALAESAANGETWLGGGIGFNSDSTGWESHEWCFQPYATDENGNPIDEDGDGKPDPIKELTWTKVSDGVYEVTFARAEGASLFSADDTYAQIWMQDWSGDNAGHVALTGVTLLSDEEIVLSPTPIDSSSEDDTSSESSSEGTTSSEAVTPVDSSEAGTSSATASGTTTSSKTTTTTNKTDSNPSTGAAALGAVGVLLAGAAMAVSKKKN